MTFLAAFALLQSPDISEMERTIQTYALLDALEADRATLERLLPIAQRARDAAEDYRRELEALRDEQLHAFQAFRAEDMQNVGFTPECEEKAARAEHGETALQRQTALRVNRLEPAVLEILNARQAELLRDPPPAGELLERYVDYDAIPSSVPQAIRNIVERARRLDDNAYAQQRESFVRQAIASLPFPIEEVKDPEAYRAGVGRELDQLRRVEDRDLDAAIARAIQEARPRPEEELLREELGAIHRARHGELGPIAAFLVQPRLVEAIERRLGQRANAAAIPASDCACNPCCCGPNCQCGNETLDRIRQLRHEINLLNLANGLGFSFHQMAHIYGEAARNGQIQEWEKSQWAPPAERDVEAYRRTVGRFLDAVETASTVPYSLLTRVPFQREAAFRRRQVSPSARVPRPQPGEPELLADNVREILYAGQLDVIVDYNPCLIPPANLKDPVRVGQANDRSAVVSAIEHVREIPAPTWRANEDRILDEMMRQAEAAHGRFPADERASRRERLAEVLDRIRSMNDVEFMVQKDALAEELDFLNREEEIKRRLVELTGEEGVARQKIQQFLLDPVMADLLRERLFDLRNRRHEGPVDLETVSPADACRDGRCAIDE